MLTLFCCLCYSLYNQARIDVLLRIYNPHSTFKSPSVLQSHALFIQGYQ